MRSLANFMVRGASSHPGANATTPKVRGLRLTRSARTARRRPLWLCCPGPPPSPATPTHEAAGVDTWSGCLPASRWRPGSACGPPWLPCWAPTGRRPCQATASPRPASPAAGAARRCGAGPGRRGAPAAGPPAAARRCPQPALARRLPSSGWAVTATATTTVTGMGAVMVTVTATDPAGGLPPTTQPLRPPLLPTPCDPWAPPARPTGLPSFPCPPPETKGIAKPSTKVRSV